MDENGWDYGEDDEELLELAMHPAQYKDYKSGKAKEKFLADLEKRKAAKQAALDAAAGKTVVAAVPVASASISTPPPPKNITVNVDGEQFKVSIAYDDEPASTNNSTSTTAVSPTPTSNSSNGALTPNNTKTIIAPIEGKFYLTKENGERGIKVGDKVQEGDTIAYIEAMKVINAITADKSGKVVEITATHGEDIDEDDVMFKIV